MHILITNDDGVASPGILALKTALEPLGRISVIAPDRNRSAIARSISIHHAISVEETALADGTPAYATDGTPVDCVRLAVLGLLEGETPDLVVSGINLGLNLGDDVTYSGTVAAALEGVLLGWPAIAVSQAPTGPEIGLQGEQAYDFTAVAGFVRRLVPHVCAATFPRRVLLSVNGPGVPPAEVRGARVTRLGRRIYHDRLELEGEEGSRRRYRIYNGDPGHEEEAGTDFEAIGNDEISVTPLHFDLTDMEGMDAVERLEVHRLLDEDVASLRGPGAP